MNTANEIGGHALLIVDDENNVIQALKRLFRRERYTILTANSGTEGLEIVRKTPVDLILSDQRMPGMSGVEFLARVREEFPSIIRMVLSGYTDVNIITSAINEGNVYKFILKPWEDDQLKEAVREALRFRWLQVENERLNEEIRKKNEELIIINQNLEKEVEKRTEKIISQSKQLKMSSDILESLPVAVVCIDINLRIIHTNSFANLLFAAEDYQIVGSFLDKVFNDDVVDVVNATIDLGLPQGSSIRRNDIYQYGLKSTPIMAEDEISMVILSFYELD